MKTTLIMTAQEKLNLISEKLGFPFAINAHGYDHNTNRFEEGIQAWSCDEDEYDRAAGVKICVFLSQEDINDYYEGNYLFDSVESAKFVELMTEDNRNSNQVIEFKSDIEPGASFTSWDRKYLGGNDNED